jgi:hypothetical protein
MKMIDADVSMGDNNLTKSLRDVYDYEKVAVPFTDVQSLYDCPYLGGLGKMNAKTFVA